MEMAKAGQRHRLQLTPHKRTPLVAAAAAVYFIAFKIGKLGVSLSVKFSRVSLLLFVQEGAETIVPAVLSELDLELVHESPKVDSVAFAELFEVMGTAAEEFLACQMGGACEDEVFLGRSESDDRRICGVSVGFGVWGFGWF